MSKITQFTLYNLVALILYSVLFIWFTHPLYSNISIGYIGFQENGDAHQYYWNIFNFKEQVYHSKNPFFSNYIFAPDGTSLFMHTYTPIIGLFALIFTNNILALNIFLFLSFILSAFGAYLLCNKLINNTILSISAGIVYAFCPYKLIHLLEHYHLLLTAAIPFFIICFLEAFRFSKGRFFPKILNKYYFFACLILSIILLISDYYSTFSVLYFCFFYALYYKIFAIINYKKKEFWLITFLVLIISHIILHQFKVNGIDNKGGIWWSGDLLGYIIPHFNGQWFYSNWFAELEKKIYHYPGSVEYCMFLGYSILILIFIFIWWIFKNSLPENLKPFAFISLIFFLMTVPDFKLMGHSLFNFPLSFFHYIPFFNNIRSPTRMLPMVALLFMPIGLYALSSLIIKKNVSNFTIGLSFCLLLIVEYKPIAYPIVKVNEVPQIINKLKGLPEGNLLHIPFGVRDGFIEKGKFETKKLWYQTIHKKPLIDGYISRLNKKTVESFNSSFFLDIELMQKNHTYKSGIKNLELPVTYILIEPQYRSNFEPFIDTLLKNKNNSKIKSEGYLLYTIDLNH